MISWCVAYKYHNRKVKNPTLTFFSLLRNGKIAKISKNRISHTDLAKIIVLCEEYFEESCFDKWASLPN